MRHDGSLVGKGTFDLGPTRAIVNLDLFGRGDFRNPALNRSHDDLVTDMLPDPRQQTSERARVATSPPGHRSKPGPARFIDTNRRRHSRHAGRAQPARAERLGGPWRHETPPETASTADGWLGLRGIAVAAADVSSPSSKPARTVSSPPAQRSSRQRLGQRSAAFQESPKPAVVSQRRSGEARTSIPRTSLAAIEGWSTPPRPARRFVAAHGSSNSARPALAGAGVCRSPRHFTESGGAPEHFPIRPDRQLQGGRRSILQQIAGEPAQQNSLQAWQCLALADGRSGRFGAGQSPPSQGLRGFRQADRCPLFGGELSCFIALACALRAASRSAVRIARSWAAIASIRRPASASNSPRRSAPEAGEPETDCGKVSIA